jgi:NDP-sugar pyrophosphorylase family protein
MILAAGLGTRLRPLTNTCPKPLIDVGGRPMIAFALDLVRAAGITEVAINLHHLGSQLRAALGHGEKYGVRITFFDEETILETGGGIANARNFLEGDEFVVLNADTMTDLRLTDIIAFHRRHSALATMFLRPDPAAQRYGAIEIDSEHRIRRFLGQPAAVDVPLRQLMFGGVHVFAPRVFDYLPSGVYSITKTTYPRMLQAKEPLYGYVFEGYWQVLDTPAGLAAGRDHVARRGSAAASST